MRKVGVRKVSLREVAIRKRSEREDAQCEKTPEKSAQNGFGEEGLGGEMRGRAVDNLTEKILVWREAAMIDRSLDPCAVLSRKLSDFLPA